MNERDLVKKTATRITHENGVTKVFYHSTPIVEFNLAMVRLNTAGHKTRTTKLRMNQASEVYGLKFRVYQKNHDWFVETRHGTLEFDEPSISFAS